MSDIFHADPIPEPPENEHHEFGICPSCGEKTWAISLKHRPIHMIWCSNNLCQYKESR